MLDGWIIVDKPIGLTSMDICKQIRINYKTKVGHAGTLDPLATGILPIAMGNALKLIEFIHMNKKRYIFKVEWGKHTDTYDITGQVLQTNNIRNINYLDQIKHFIGTISQIPPIFSAIKVNGIPAYKMARAGEKILLSSRSVEIYMLNVLNYNTDYAIFDVICSKGTYVRTLAVDIAHASGMIGTVSEIRRIEYGVFNESHIGSNIFPVNYVLSFPKIYLDINQTNKFINGQNISCHEDICNQLCTVMYFNNVLGIGKIDNQGYIKPIKVLITDRKHEWRNST